MDVAAAITWAVTAVIGLGLTAAYVRRGGHHDNIDAVRDATLGRLPGGRPDTDAPTITSGLVAGHAAIALIGLLLLVAWAGNQEETDWDHGGWGVVTFVLATAALGIAMFVSWRQPEHQASRAVRSMPPSIVYLHGLAGVATVVLVVAAALAN